jgi:hypothetical protein
MGECKVCSKPLWRGNQTGHCKQHIAPEVRAKMTESLRRKIQSDPAYLERLRTLARANSSRPGHMEKMHEGRDRAKPWIKALAAVTPESYLKAGRRSADTKLAWCPPEYRAEYHRLTNAKRFTASEAKAMVLDQHAKDMAEFRRKLKVA